MIKRLLCLAVALSFTNIIPLNLCAQSIATADLRITVRDPQGAIVRDVVVTARSETHEFERATRTNAEGEALFLSLAPEEYRVWAEAAGFARTTIEGVRLTVGQMAVITVHLKLPLVSEEVTANAAPEMVDVERTSSITTISEQNINSLPINGRNYINFSLIDSKLNRDGGASIGAAPTSGLNFGGQRARSNLVNVDGADSVDNSVNGIRSTVSQEAVQEFQIQTSGFAAEYGRATGGVVNIITKSGTNDWHGSAFAYLRNRNIQATNPFSTEVDPAYTRVQPGVTIGGPLKKNKSYLFFSYEGTRRHETAFSSIGANGFGLVPFDTVPLAPLLGLGGNSFGTLLLTPDQARFATSLATAIKRLPQEQQTSLLASFQKLFVPYLTLAGGGAGVALNGVLPSRIMLPIVDSMAAESSLPGPSGMSAFASSGTVIPESFVTLNSIRGNYPIIESTDLASIRFDHRFTNENNGSIRLGLSPGFLTGIQSSEAAANTGLSAWSRSSQQRYRDWTVTAQDVWALTADKVNELRFQYAYRGLRFSNSGSRGGNSPAVSIAGFAFFGREPISYVNRTEERFQFTDNFTVAQGRHRVKAGIDINILPATGEYTMYFGGAYAFGNVRAGSFLTDDSGNPLDQLDLTAYGLGKVAVPGFSPVQAYGLGVPQHFVQGMGDPHQRFTNKVFAGFVQDTWRFRPTLTLNYGLRYDVELTPEFRAVNDLSGKAEKAMGVMQGIPRDFNNVAPRIGVAWSPSGDGATVIRASYGIFYDHPLLALAFDSDVADGTQAAQIVLFGGTPGCASGNVLNATNAFQGLLSCLPATFNYVPAEQRFNSNPKAPSIFLKQQYLAAGVPLLMQPLTMPVARTFQYAYANQANVALERQFKRNFSLGLEYNFSGGRHLNRPMNRNAARGDLLKLNYDRATVAIDALAASGVPANMLNRLRPSDPLSVAICPKALRQLGFPQVWSADNFVPAALVSFFRPSGLNSSLLAPGSPLFACSGEAKMMLQEFGLGVGVPVPFSDIGANHSDGNSAYHAFTANLRKRMTRNYEFFASYTWSHAIDNGSMDLQTGLGPQDSYHPERERSNSAFDQRHRFVFSGIIQSGSRFTRGLSRLLNNWTVAPIIEIGSGRPFNIVTYTDRNFDFTVSTDRPLIVSSGTVANTCGDPVIASEHSPTGYFQLPCYRDPIPTYTGNLGRNAGIKPWTVFQDLRLAREVRIGDRLKAQGILDIFNIVNRFNVADVNPLYTSAGVPTAAFDPRQFQLAVRVIW